MANQPTTHQHGGALTRANTRIQFERITHCPETNRDLNGLDIAKHARTLWPDDQRKNYMSDEAQRRFDLLMHEHQARETERGMSHGDD